eukprot:scaffold14879_cov122-Isochrysis_galbana.AAC.1
MSRYSIGVGAGCSAAGCWQPATATGKWRKATRPHERSERRASGYSYITVLRRKQTPHGATNQAGQEAKSEASGTGKAYTRRRDMGRWNGQKGPEERQQQMVNYGPAVSQPEQRDRTLTGHMAR